MLNLCDNQAQMKAVKRWVDEGGKDKQSKSSEKEQQQEQRRFWSK